MNYPCPACGFEVFDEPPGSYDICGVCGWEDDHVQLRHPCLRGGANKQSLWEFQQEVLPMLSTKKESNTDLQRCSDWRPLEEEDCQDTDNVPKNGVEYFESAASKNPPYYWRRS